MQTPNDWHMTIINSKWRVNKPKVECVCSVIVKSRRAILKGRRRRERGTQCIVINYNHRTKEGGPRRRGEGEGRGSGAGRGVTTR